VVLPLAAVVLGLLGAGGWRLEAGELGSALGIGGDWAEDTSSSEPVSCEM
jgi:hypothetical protein